MGLELTLFKNKYLIDNLSDSGILQIDKNQTHRLYDTCYKVLKCYSDSAACKFSSLINLKYHMYDTALQ